MGTSGREEIQYVPRSLGASLSLTSGSSLSHKKSNRNISPPRRDDDANGHYVFELGENLTRRCKDLTIFASSGIFHSENTFTPVQPLFECHFSQHI